MDLRYVGNGTYCYANSPAMLLAAAGEERSSGLLECLTTVGIGALGVGTPDGELVFFSNYAPDQGVSLALETLGYAFDRAHCRPEDDPEGRESLERLRAWLRRGPVLVGPLDMGHLTYNPFHEHAAGADHFVVVHGATANEVFLHDPAGFPYAALGLGDFLAAWRAEAVPYREGSYSLWGNPRRDRHPDSAAIFAATNDAIARHLREQDGWAGGGIRYGSAVIRDLADRARGGGLPPALWGHLAHFALQLGAVRAGDCARFYAPNDPERAALRTAQARAFGAAHVAVAHRDWAGLAGALEGVADCDERFARATLAVPSIPIDAD